MLFQHAHGSKPKSKETRRKMSRRGGWSGGKGSGRGRRSGGRSDRPPRRGPGGRDDRPRGTQGFFLTARNVPPHKRTVALVLCLFFGWCGAHRFYLGQKGIGALYIVLLIVSGLFSSPIIILVFWVLDLICLFIARSSDRRR